MRIDRAPRLKGTAVNRVDRIPTFTSLRPFGRVALISPASASIDQRGSRKAPMRAPPPNPLLRLRLLSKVPAVAKAPNSTVPRCCAKAGTVHNSAATPIVNILSDM
jgi:hypothetical protein